MNGRKYIRAARAYTATAQGVVEDAAVVLDGDKISDVLPATEMKREDEKIAEYPGSTILPGLIDAHCHLTLAGDGRPYAELARDPDTLMALVSVHNMKRHLTSGVTTLRDNGGRNLITFAVREAIERGYVNGPRLLLAGRPVTHSRGHFHWCNGVADGTDEIRRVVRELVADGADHIKIMASGGGTLGTKPYLPSYNVDELTAAVEAARELATPTTAHCRAKSAVMNAVDAGLDCIEHFEFLVKDDSVRYAMATAGSRIDYDPAATQKVLEEERYVSFTMQAAYDTLLKLRNVSDSRILTERDRQRRDALEWYFEAKLELFQRLLDDGLLPRLVVSTDAGCGDDEFGRLHLGLELAVAGGMSPLQAIDAVTITAAAAAGVSDIVGTLAPGKVADLVVIDGNPLQDIKDMRKVSAVYQSGSEVLQQSAVRAISGDG